METFRLSQKKHAAHLSGKGAALVGGRWNSRGTEIVYTASNRSLAMAEVAVHMTMGTVPSDYMMTTIHIPDNVSLQTVHEKDLPKGWNTFPHSGMTQRIGDEFVRKNKYCLLKIPSAVTRGDFNILINPAHGEFGRISIVSVDPFPFDARIFR